MKSALLALSLLVGCAQVTPREVARASVLGVAEALRVADVTCAAQTTIAAGTGKTSLEVARKQANTCADAYDLSRSAVLSAARSVDTWESARAQHDVACFVAAANDGLVSIVAVIRAVGGKLPLVVDDGLALAKLLAGRCAQ